MDKLWTVSEIIRWSRDYLREKHLDKDMTAFQLEAEVLLSHALSCKRIEFYAEPNRPLIKSETDLFKSLLLRRIRGEPLAYITGEKEFYGLRFFVSPAVLVPRADSETLVEEAERIIRGQPNKKWRVADLCAGSGCLGISLAARNQNVFLTGVEVSTEALEIAHKNAERHKVTERTSWIAGDVLENSFWENSRDAFDLIIANPPYLASAEKNSLSVSVKDFEPPQALFADEDGFAFYRTFAKHAMISLGEPGLILMEMGVGQGATIREIFAQHQAWDKNISIKSDLEQRERVICVTKRSDERRNLE